ncbi:MAG: DUF4157 domain-containing protein [Nitrososphaera sp.]|nr:DUF4157 domain-containing protein [Nitrososphaera sp.]
MSGPTPSKTSERKRQQAEGPAQELTRRPTPSGPEADLLALQDAAGNRAVSQLLQPDTGISPPAANGVPPIVEEVLRSGSGQPLDAVTRADMEARFGEDFSHVRVHTGVQAAESAEIVNARAYTTGHNVVFDSGQYAPQTPGGKQLLAHELAHIVQQRNTSPDFASGLKIPVAGNAFEQEADRAVAAIVHQQFPTVSLQTSGPQVQRVPWGPCPPGRSLPATSELRYLAAELKIVWDYYLRERRGKIATNIYPLEYLASTGEEGDMIRAAQEQFLSDRPSAIRRTQRIGSTKDVTQSPGESSSEQILGRRPALEEAERVLKRPDILDFSRREVYDVTTEQSAPDKVSKINNDYVQRLERIRQEAGIGGKSWEAGKTLPAPPPNILSYRVTPAEVICYGSTDFDIWPGVIAYNVIDTRSQDKKKESKSQSKSQTTGAEDATAKAVRQAFMDKFPSWVPTAIREYALEATEGIHPFPGLWPGGYQGAIILWVDESAIYRDIQVYQEYPEDIAFYRQFTESNIIPEQAARQIQQVVTTYNREMREFIQRKGLSPEQAKGERAYMWTNITRQLGQAFMTSIALSQTMLGFTSSFRPTTYAPSTRAVAAPSRQVPAPKGTSRPEIPSGPVKQVPPGWKTPPSGYEKIRIIRTPQKPGLPPPKPIETPKRLPQ